MRTTSAYTRSPFARSTATAASRAVAIAGKESLPSASAAASGSSVTLMASTVAGSTPRSELSRVSGVVSSGSVGLGGGPRLVSGSAVSVGAGPVAFASGVVVGVGVEHAASARPATSASGTTARPVRPA